MSIGLVLSGGGVKGAAHIGALKALEEEKIKIDYIVGTSSGSIVASLYAAGYNSGEIYNIFKEYCNRIKYISFKNVFKGIYGVIFKRKLLINGLNDGYIIEKIINMSCADKGIESITDIRFPIAMPSVDLCNGDVLIFTNKLNRKVYSDEIKHINNINIGKAVRASCSFPGIFSPCMYNGKFLIDGGVRENIAWKEAKTLGADKVLCITFEKDIKQCPDENIIEVVSGAINLMTRELYNYEINGADCVIEVKTQDVSLLDIKKIDYCYKRGYQEVKRNIKRIKKELL